MSHSLGVYTYVRGLERKRGELVCKAESAGEWGEQNGEREKESGRTISKGQKNYDSATP